MNIYAMNIEELKATEETELIEMLDIERKQKVMRIKSSEDRLRSIAAGLLLQYTFILSGHTTEEWKKVIHKKTDNGKPFFENYKDFHFSISHSGEYAVCCASEYEIGIDIQKEKKLFYNIAERFFSKEENKKLSLEKNEKKKEELFYKMWTAKESYTKLVGTNIAMGIQNFISEIDSKHIFDQIEKRYADIDFERIGSDYVICVSSFKANPKINLIHVSKEELLEECYANYNREKCSI